MPERFGVSEEVVHFDPFSDEFFSDPFETYRRLRDHAPVYYSEQYDFWALSRYEDVAPATTRRTRRRGGSPSITSSIRMPCFRKG